MRLDKFLSDMNMGTRTELKRDIRKGAVQVNGEKITDPGFMVNENDEIIFAGEPVPYFRYEYYMLNKPAGVITATEDRYQKTVLDFFGERRRKDLSPVGRLDFFWSQMTAVFIIVCFLQKSILIKNIMPALTAGWMRQTGKSLRKVFMSMKYLRHFLQNL
mgnify:CR=1 FL=1